MLLLSCVDTEGYPLMADPVNHCLQLMSPRGQFSVVMGLEDLKSPWDVVVRGQEMFVLYGQNGKTKYVQKFKINNWTGSGYLLIKLYTFHFQHLGTLDKCTFTHFHMV